MDPKKPEPTTEPDPFFVDDDAPDDESLDWADDAPRPDADPLDAVDDADGTDLDEPPWRDPVPLPTVEESDDDADPFSEEALSSEELDARVHLPWRTEAVVVALGRTLPAVLDPTRPGSAWIGGPTASAGSPIVLWLGPLTLKLDLERVPGEPESLVLGRDALVGRVAIDV